MDSKYVLLTIAGTYFLLYDFIDFFEKDGPSYLQRDKYHDIIDTIFKNMSQLARDAITFQVCMDRNFFCTFSFNPY